MTYHWLDQKQWSWMRFHQFEKNYALYDKLWSNSVVWVLYKV